jgi:hypothetical protein
LPGSSGEEIVANSRIYRKQIAFPFVAKTIGISNITVGSIGFVLLPDE